jgi:hypothetical protein
MQQITSEILMIRPARFGSNPETLENNAFQSKEEISDNTTLSAIAVEEFDNMVAILRSHGIQVLVHEDSPIPSKPDAVFPNNWVSFHEDGAVITYPMFAPSRRMERREDIIELVGAHFVIKNRYSFEFYENEHPAAFLEGTGSMVFDRSAKVVYACLSPRTDASLIDKFCVLTGMDSCIFKARDENGVDIYHTNVMMAIGLDFAVVCLDAIAEQSSRNEVSDFLQKSGKDIIPITLKQMGQFAGNMLEVKDIRGNRHLCMSQTAYESLDEHQKQQLSAKTNILAIPIPNIEKFGGGSVRCMMAEIFLPKK